MKRSKACELFLKHNEVNSVSIKTDDRGETWEPSFSWSGCDCCNNGLGTDVYECEGYSPKHKEVFNLGDVCHECICYFYNGECEEVI